MLAESSKLALRIDRTKLLQYRPRSAHRAQLRRINGLREINLYKVRHKQRYSPYPCDVSHLWIFRLSDDFDSEEHVLQGYS